MFECKPRSEGLQILIVPGLGRVGAVETFGVTGGHPWRLVHLEHLGAVRDQARDSYVGPGGSWGR